jgi:hypothetical protein
MLRDGVVLLALAVVTTVASTVAASAPVSADEQLESSSSTALVAVEEFLAARAAGDVWGAAGHCAALLELQDVDGSWFIDTAATSDWLNQLTARYSIDILSAPHVEGATVTWTERLVPRNMRFPEALSASMRVDVYAVIRDGKIVYLSAPYPPFPLRQNGLATGTPGGGPEPTKAAAPPVTMFIGAAAVFALAAASGASLNRRHRHSGQRRRGYLAEITLRR